jgi:alkyl hydroperoxide reductase subunit AhpF
VTGRSVADDALDLSTDVLVVGGGPAGCWAAIAAREVGAKGGIKASGIDRDLSHRLPEPDGTPWER